MTNANVQDYEETIISLRNSMRSVSNVSRAITRNIRRVCHYARPIVKAIFRLILLLFFTSIILVVIANTVPSTVEAMPEYGEVVECLETKGNSFFTEVLNFLK